MTQNREELLNHLAASLKDAQKDGGAILLVGAGISVSAGIPPAQKLMKIAIENFPNYFTEDEQRLAKEDLNQLQYNVIMGKLSSLQRKEIFNWHIKGNEQSSIPPTKLNFAHLAIAQLLKQGYIKRVLTTNFDPLLINACYMVGMYPLPAIYDLGSAQQVNPELFDDPCLVYLNGQHAGQIQRNTPSQLETHKSILHKVVQSTGCKKTWLIAGYSGENDPLMDALNELRPYNNWLYWLEYNNQISQKESHHFLENDEECKVIYECDADETFMHVADLLNCSLDFIEKPCKELEMCLKEINFNSVTYLKGRIYKILIEKYIDLLSNDENIKKFQDIEKTELLLQKILGLMASFSLVDSPNIDDLNQNIAFLKNQYLEHKIIDILEAFCMGLCEKFKLLENISIIKNDIEFALTEAQLHKKKSATLHAQIIRLHCILNDLESALTELKLFPILDALERKQFFSNNSEMRKLRELSKFKEWYLETFNETYKQ